MNGQAPAGLYRRMLIRVLVVLAAIALLLTVGVWILRLLLPFLAAGAAAWVLNGATAALLKRISLPRKTTVMLVAILMFVASAVFLGYLGWRIVTETMELGQSWQSIFESFINWLENIGSQMRRLSQDELNLIEQVSDTVRSAISGVVDSLSAELMSWAGEYARRIPSVLLGVVVFIFATFLILADYDALHTKLNNILSQDPDNPIHTVKHILKGAFGEYLGKLLALCVIVTFVDMVGLLILGVRYAALLALAMGILDFLPYVGSGTILIPWGVVCLFSGKPVLGVGLLLLYLLVRIVRQYFGRRFMEKRAEFGVFGTLICVFLGWKLWGAGGIILGPVVVMILVNLYHSGFFDATLEDCKLALRDIRRRMGLTEDESEP